MNDKLGKSQVEEERFHDLIHSVTSDGLQDMAWPGMRKKDKPAEKKISPDNKVVVSKPEKKISEPPPENKQEAEAGNTIKADKKSTTKDYSKTDKVIKPKEISISNEKPKRKSEKMVKSLDGEWDEHTKRLEAYNSREQKAKRYAIFLPEKVYESFHFVYSRNASASMSIVLQMFIERNKGRMLDAISDRTTIL